MKTLNKTLCLVLAMVMVLGLFGVASAADFTDQADVKYTEAVGVMTGIGAINGYEDNSFKPAGNITRAEAAKLVAYAVLTPDVAKTLPAGTSSFTDVDANTQKWAGPFIEYFVSKGVINGRGDGTFDPTGKVTGNELAKMMLVAAGYGKQSEYTGASWELNVAIDAAKLGIFKGSKAASNSVSATREEAALYTFNGITKVEPVKYDKNTSSYVAADDGQAVLPVTNPLYKTLYPKLMTATVDAADNGGVAGTQWYISKDGAGAYDKANDTLIGVFNTEAAAATSYTAGTTVADIAKALGVKVGATEYTIEVYRNGAEKQTLTKTGTELYAMTAAEYTIPGGVTAQVVTPANTTNTFRILYTVHYLAQLTKVTTDATDDGIDTRSLKLKIVGYGASGSAYEAEFTAKDYAGFDTIFGMVKDQTTATLTAKPIMVDVVPVADSYTATTALQSAEKTTILSVALPTTVDGKATATNATKNTVTVADKTYVVGHKVNFTGMVIPFDINDTSTSLDTAPFIDFAKDYTFVIDATGAIAAIKPVDTTAAQGDVYYATGYVFTKSTETEFGTVASYYAQVVDMTGKASSVMIGAPTAKDNNTTYDKTEGVDKITAGLYTFATDTESGSKSSTLGFKKATAVSANFEDINNTSVTVASTQVASGGAKVTVKSTVIAAANIDESTKVYLTDKTQYIFAVDAGAGIELNTVTGGINFTIPEDSYVVVTKDTDGNYIASAVVMTVEYTNAGVASDTVLYFTGATPTLKAYTDASGVTRTGYVYTAYDATGAEKTITATNASVAKGFWTYKVVNDIYTTVAELGTDKGAYEGETYTSKVGTQITTTSLIDKEAGSAVIVDLRTAAEKTASGVATLATLADIAAASKTITMDIFTTTTNSVQSVAIIFVTGPTE